MIKTEFMKIYEELEQLNEKWYDIKGYGRRLWFSNSAIEFKNFMKNIWSIQELVIDAFQIFMALTINFT